ncbi:hypothetical protein Tco_0533929 [Tanacetum coccineum]
MFDIVPPIPPPFGVNISNPSSPNRAGNPTDNINNTTTTNVVQNVVDENLPQLLDSRGGSRVTNVLEFDKEDFSSWKDRRLANQDKRLKSILISCLPNDVMKSVIKCTSAQAIWTDLIMAHEGPSETKDTKIAALRLKFIGFKALEGERVNGTFTRLKSLLNDLENNGVLISQAEDSDSDIEEDQRSSSEFLADLNDEFHERALLANQRRFYKNSGMDEESMSFDDEGVTTFKALMTIADEELSVGRADARIHVLDYTHVDIHYVDDQRKNLLGKLNSLKQEFSSCKSELTDLKNTKALNSSHQNEITKLSLENESLKDEISDLKKVIEKWTSSRITLDQLLTEQVPGNIVKALGGKGIRKEKFTSKEVCRIPYITSLHITITNLRSRREKES